MDKDLRVYVKMLSSFYPPESALYSFFKNKYKIMLISFFVLDKVCIFITDFYVLS